MNLKLIGLLWMLLAFKSSQFDSQFSWDNVNGTSFVGQSRNQNFPAACNSGWAFSAIDVLNSRVKIRRNGESPDISLSPQVLLSCDNTNYGCMGGEPLTAFRWIKSNNITDESCHSYTAKGYTNGYGCSSVAKCQRCNNNVCIAVPNSKIYSIVDYGTVGRQGDMQQEIKSWGPITCGINADSLHNYTHGIINKNSGSSRVNHFVMVYGWGQQQGVKYWKVKNSWGPAWGEKGYFRVERGKNLLQIQRTCYWSNLLDTWTHDIRNNTVPNSVNSQIGRGYQIPKYLTPSKNYQTPNSCETSAAFSVIQMIADRQSILTTGKYPITLSAQVLLNCGIGKCQKQASPSDILVFIQKYGLSQEGCQTYQAVNPIKESCTVSANCATCQGSVFQSKCAGLSSYKKWKIRDHGVFSGVQNMKIQLVAGPIVCGIQRTKQFENYRGGIFNEITVAPKINHYVEVVGIVNDSGKQCWLGRSMWGTAWGQSSFFRMEIGKNTIGIQSKCFYGSNLL